MHVPSRGQFRARNRLKALAPCVRSTKNALAIGRGIFCEGAKSDYAPVRMAEWIVCPFMRYSVTRGDTCTWAMGYAHAVAHAVRDWLGRRVADRRTNDFITSTFGEEGTRELQAEGKIGHVLQNLTWSCRSLDTSIALFLDFLLHPDDTLCLAVEQQLLTLCGDVCRVPDGFAGTVADLLTDVEVTLWPEDMSYLTAGAYIIKFTVPSMVLRSLLCRLYMDRILPGCVGIGHGETGMESLCSMVCNDGAGMCHITSADSGTDPLLLMIRLVLRQTAMIYTPFRCHMIQRYLHAIPVAAPMFLQGVRLWLHVLEMLPAQPLGMEEGTGKLFDAISVRRARLIRSVLQSRVISRYMQRYTMESLMVQGGQGPVTDVAATRMEIQLLDRISMALFQRMPYGAEFTGQGLNDMLWENRGEDTDLFDPEEGVRILMDFLN